MLFANNCNTTLNGGITAVATSMVVTSATGFPSPTGSQYFYCTLADAATQTTIEIVKVTAVSGTTFTIVRGQDGTTGTIFASGAVVSLRLVRASLNDFPKLDETNTFTADQAITGQLTTSSGLVTTNSFTATAPADGLVMDYATGFGRFSAFAGDGFQWYNAGVANTKLMQLSSTGVITTATWNGTTVGVGYGGTGTSTAFTTGSIVFAGASGVYSQSNSQLFWDNPNNRLGVGITTPQNQLSLGSAAGGQIGLSLDWTGAGGPFTVAGFTTDRNTGETRIGGFRTNFFPVFYSNNAEAARIDTNGNFLQGVSSFTATFGGFQSGGVVSATGFGCRTGTGGSYGGNRFNLNWTGSAMTLYVDNVSLGTITTVSDYRIKQNIETINTSALSLVSQLRPVTYNFKDIGIFKDDGILREGFIAHEIQAVIPSAVSGQKDAVDSEGNIQPQSLQFAPIIAILTKAIQELKTEFDAYVASHP